jgi:hypothetical protein
MLLGNKQKLVLRALKLLCSLRLIPPLYIDLTKVPRTERMPDVTKLSLNRGGVVTLEKLFHGSVGNAFISGLAILSLPDDEKALA